MRGIGLMWPQSSSKRTARIRGCCQSKLIWPSFKPLSSNCIHTLPHTVSIMNRPYVGVTIAKILQQLRLRLTLLPRLPNGGREAGYTQINITLLKFSSSARLELHPLPCLCNKEEYIWTGDIPDKHKSITPRD